MTGFLRGLADTAYRFSPKLRHAVIWGWPDYEDSVIALEQALQDSEVRRVVLLMSDPTIIPVWCLGPKTIRVKKNSPVGWLWFCFAKYVFLTHPCFTRNFPRNVVSVNVWHGMPIKKIGWMIADDPGISSRFTLATSQFWAKIMEQAMTPYGGVLPLGLARNDRLFSDRRIVFEKLGLAQDLKLLAWLPTYRKSVLGLPREDGIEAGNVFEMPDLDPDLLNSFLKSHNAFMLAKPHPMARFDRSKTWSHLMIVDNAWLQERSLSLYEFLGATDLLISDISSVVIDYLLLDRPIIHAFSDLSEYRESRGFTIEPVEDYFAGPVVTEYKELTEALNTFFCGKDPDADKRHDLRNLSHTHKDAHATRRLMEALGL